MKNKKFKVIISVLILIIIILFSIIIVKTIFPLKDIDLIIKYSEEYNVDPALVSGMIHTESRFKSDAISHKGANGYMQIMEETAIWGADEIGIENFSYEDISNPEINIRIGCWYISKLINVYGDVDTALAAYNGGSGNVDKWLKDKRFSDGNIILTTPFEETNDYIKRVNFRTKIYDILISIENFSI